MRALLAGNYVSSSNHHNDLEKTLARHDSDTAEAAMANDINDAFTVPAKILA